MSDSPARFGPGFALAVIAVVAAVIGIGFWLSLGRDDGELPKPPVLAFDDGVPKIGQTDEFAGSDSCRDCHKQQHASWHKTFHRTMTQKVRAETVLADFDDVELTSRNRTYRLTREGDEFWIDMPDADWEDAAQRRGVDLATVSAPRKKLPIVMSTGSHHFQGYWVPSDRGRELRQIPWVYHLAEQRWMPVEDTFIRPPDIHRRFGIWNTSCVQCHAVAGRPRKNSISGDLFSDVAELGISCESCHGPAKAHVEFRRASNAPAGQHDPIVNPAKLSHVKSSEICAQCHSYFRPADEEDWWENGYRYRAGGDLAASQTPIDHTTLHEPRNEFFRQAFWKDGTVRVGGREFSGMKLSKCFTEGELSCLSCHSLHQSDPNDLLAAGMEHDKACLQCHTKYGENMSSHTHHAADSVGSRCYNCHMPHTSFALLGGIRSHRIDSPNVTQSLQSGRPNACNQCHTDQSLAWTAKYTHEWFGHEVPELSEDQKSHSATVLWLLNGNAAQRALAAWTIGWEPARKSSSQGWQIPILAEGLRDPYAVVRFVSAKSTQKFDGFEDFDYDFVAGTPVRESRIEALLKSWTPRAIPTKSVKFVGDNHELFRLEVRRLLESRDNIPIELPE